MKPIDKTPMQPQALERRIAAISKKVQNENLDRDYRKALFAEMALLIKSRSRETVAAMEKAKGLTRRHTKAGEVQV